MDPVPIYNVERLVVHVEADLTDLERYTRTGCITKLDKKGNPIFSLDSECMPPARASCPYLAEVWLVGLDHYLLTWQVLSRLFRFGFSPVCFEELAAISEQDPQKQLIRPIVSIYETVNGEGVFGYAAHVLSGDKVTRQRTFTSLSAGDGWGANCWFAVKKTRAD